MNPATPVAFLLLSPFLQGFDQLTAGLVGFILIRREAVHVIFEIKAPVEK